MLLEAKNLGFYHDKQSWIIRDLDFKIESGEVVGLIGPSGCGKTTLASILAGYVRPKAGAVTMDGHPIKTNGYHPVQLVHQHPEKAVNPRWKMRKILNEGGKVERFLLDALGIKDEWLNRWPNELSGGELQRMCVARALGDKTQFLIADEMTSMLDAITQAQIWQVILELVEQRGLGVLVVSHDRSLLRRIGHRTYEMSEGELKLLK